MASINRLSLEERFEILQARVNEQDQTIKFQARTIMQLYRRVGDGERRIENIYTWIRKTKDYLNVQIALIVDELHRLHKVKENSRFIASYIDEKPLL